MKPSDSASLYFCCYFSCIQARVSQIFKSLKINDVLDEVADDLLVENVADLNQDFCLLVIVELPALLVLD